jgi:phenylacetate-CoA ligase
VIDPETDKSLGETGYGELCVTMLIDGIKPLLRYRTGDMVEIIKTDRPEPHDLKVNVIGRTRDRIILNNKDYTAFHIENSILSPLTSCFGYQIIIDKKNGEDTLEVNLEFADGTKNIQALCDAVSNSCAENLNINASVTLVEELDQIVSTASFVSWKAARIIDKRQEISHEVKVAMKMAENRDYR